MDSDIFWILMVLGFYLASGGFIIGLLLTFFIAITGRQKVWRYVKWSTIIMVIGIILLFTLFLGPILQALQMKFNLY